VIGDSKVGKTSIIQRYTNNTFTHSTLSTIGSDFTNKIISISNSVINLNIWDTAGQERFRCLTSQYYKRASGILIVFDLTSRESFEGINAWLDDLKRNSDEDKTIKLLIGNKSDLPRKVSFEQAKNFASRRSLNYLETSALEDLNISKAFEELANIMWENRSSLIKVQPENHVDFKDTKKIVLSKTEVKQRGCCKRGKVE
jgi:Ras-related protein Rab-11A